MYSYWEKMYWYDRYDYLIVGSGIVGLFTAIAIRKRFPDARIAVVERGHLPTGASTKNAGFACFGTVGELMDDLNKLSEQEVIDTIAMRWKGLQLLKSMVTSKQMDLKEYGGYELVDDEDTFSMYHDRLDYINGLIQTATGINKAIEQSELRRAKSFYDKCFFNSHEAQLNPALLIRRLKTFAERQKITLINGYEVKGHEEYEATVRLTNGSTEIQAGRVVYCTNAFTGRILPGYDIVPARNLVMITKTLDRNRWKGCFHYNRGYIYFRNIDGRLLLGGARNVDLEKETTDQFGENTKVRTELEQFLVRLGFAPGDIDMTWSGIIATGKSKKPIVKPISDRVYLAVRLGGMGIAIGAGVAQELAEML